MASRADQKRELREERQRREQEDTRRDRTRKRLGILAGVGAAAAVVVVALILIGGGGGDKGGASKKGAGVAGAAQTRTLLAGIPQHGEVLGKPTAPVTLVQYVDLQCPFCAQFDTKALPEVIQRYVRTGKVRLEQRTLRILGSDSSTAATWAAAAAQRNRLFQFSGVFYRNQGEENTGYVTRAYLDKIARGAGLDPAELAKASKSSQSGGAVVDAENEASQFGFDSTPSFALGRTGGKLKALQVGSLTAGAVTGPIDQLLGNS
jgi:protein-disulfide isomerase